ncbi:hypothetical protein [Nonlabens ponticola]|uniref:Uncharacterized protein n=1 Tax=Nonlabens ponticola TaxID=2496866 RepID=A0A3S9MYJ1_9FLAO|nr:hypothetical protein [Nonlabens ponticola]AZQ44184.1 hypothetical protein EJ995_08040 [Nonlabens ponticola]
MEHISQIQSSMKEMGVKDYFIVQYIQYGTITFIKKGYSKKKVCLPKRTYYQLFAFWNKNESNFIQKFDNCGKFEPIKLSQSEPLEYYLDNKQEIIISEVKQYQIGENEYTTVTHQPLRYYWFTAENKNYTSDFDKFDLTTSIDSTSFISKPNLNYEYNQELPIVKLNKKAEDLIAKLSVEKKFQRE